MLIKRARYGIGIPRVPALSHIPSTWKTIFRSNPKPPVFMYASHEIHAPMNNIRQHPTTMGYRIKMRQFEQQIGINIHKNGKKGNVSAVHNPTKNSKNNSVETNTGEESDIFNVPQNIRNVLKHRHGVWVGVVSLEDHHTYVKVGDKIFKEIPPSVSIQGSQVGIKSYIDIAKKYAALTDNGKVHIVMDVGHFAFPELIITKDGKIIVPDYWKPYVHVDSNGNIWVDVDKLRRNFAYKWKGKKVKVQISVRGKINGIVGGIAGTSVDLDL